VPHSLDAQLRDVPLPDGFVRRLKASLARETAPADRDVDDALRAVAVPLSVLLRLREIAADVEIDAAPTSLAALPELSVTLPRPSRRARMQRAERALGRIASAATWFVAIWTSLAAAVGGLVVSTFPRQPADIGLAVIYEGPLTLTGEPETLEPAIEMRPEPVPSEEEEQVYWTALVRPSFVSRSRAWDWAPIAQLAEPETDEPQAGPGPVGEWTQLVARGLRPLDDTFLPAHAANLPNDVLERIAVQLNSGKLPDFAELCVEDFLAAMDYDFPLAPGGRLMLHTAAGPSPFGNDAVRLVHIAVQAGTNARDVQLTIKFHPENVAAYRVVGRDTAPCSSTEPVTCDLKPNPGAATSVLLEVWLQGDGNDVARAGLTWTDPFSGEPCRQQQPIRRDQFAATIAEAPAPLVQAALAAQVGEFLCAAGDAQPPDGGRGDGGLKLVKVAAVAQQVDSRLRHRPDVVRLLKLVEQLQAAGFR
jgi:hypothetical protein